MSREALVTGKRLLLLPIRGRWWAKRYAEISNPILFEAGLMVLPSSLRECQHLSFMSFFPEAKLNHFAQSFIWAIAFSGLPARHLAQPRVLTNCAHIGQSAKASLACVDTSRNLRKKEKNVSRVMNHKLRGLFVSGAASLQSEVVCSPTVRHGAQTGDLFTSRHGMKDATCCCMNSG